MVGNEALYLEVVRTAPMDVQKYWKWCLVTCTENAYSHRGVVENISTMCNTLGCMHIHVYIYSRIHVLGKHSVIRHELKMHEIMEIP